MNSYSPLLSSWLCQLLVALGAACVTSTIAAGLQVGIDGNVLQIALIIALFTLAGIVLWLITTQISSKRTAAHIAYWSPQLLMCLYTAFALWDVLRRQTSDGGASWVMFSLVCLLAASGGAYVALLILER